MGAPNHNARNSIALPFAEVGIHPERAGGLGYLCRQTCHDARERTLPRFITFDYAAASQSREPLSGLSGDDHLGAETAEEEHRALEEMLQRRMRPLPRGPYRAPTAGPPPRGRKPKKATAEVHANSQSVPDMRPRYQPWNKPVKSARTVPATVARRVFAATRLAACLRFAGRPSCRAGRPGGRNRRGRCGMAGGGEGLLDTLRGALEGGWVPGQDGPPLGNERRVLGKGKGS